MPISSLLRESAAKAVAAGDHARRMLEGPGVVLFGAGGLGRIVLRGLRQRGVTIEAFADNDRRRWHQAIDGVTVLPPEEAVAAFGDAVFIVAIWNASPRRNQADVLGQLRDMGCRHVLSFAWAFRRFPDVFLPYFAVDRFENVLRASEAIEAAYVLLGDDLSREIFLRQIEWRITVDFLKLGFPDEQQQYFSADVYRLRDDERFVDCGAFDGDTLRQFVSLTAGTFSHYWALEPDAQNREKLARFVASLPPEVASRVAILSVAASDRRGKEMFDATGSGSSAFSASGAVMIDCAPLDELVDVCTLIKIDVEGAEPRVLQGARRLIADHAPVWAAAAYHTQSHIWELPLLVRSLNPQYRFFYREHNAEAFDLVLYAIPRAR